MITSSSSWRSNLLFLSLLFIVILCGSGVSAAESNTDTNGIASPARSEGLINTIKHIYKVAINGPDPTLLYERDLKDGIIRLTDENYVEMVEHPLGGGEKDELWVVLVHGKPTDVNSETMLNYHKQAKDLVVLDPDLTNIKFARIDYMTSWKICSRWLLTKPPILVFISSNGKDIRFIPVQSLSSEPENLYKVIKDKIFEVVLPWNSRWSPNGDRAYLIEYYIIAHDKISKLTSGIPNWILLAFTGILTQQLMSWLHGSSPNRTPNTPTQGNASNTRTGNQVVREEKVVVKED